MTIEERNTARAIQTLAALQSGTRINWEQRRYEIAKDILAANRSHGMPAAVAVKCADDLIRELRNTPMT